MAQTENELIPIKAPMSPVIDVVMPPLREGGVSMVDPVYDNSMANYYENLRATMKTTAAAFTSIMKTAEEKTKWDLKKKLETDRDHRDSMLNLAKIHGHMPDLEGKQYSVEAIKAMILDGAKNNTFDFNEDEAAVFPKKEDTTASDFWSIYSIGSIDDNKDDIPDYLERQYQVDVSTDYTNRGTADLYSYYNRKKKKKNPWFVTFDDLPELQGRGW